MDTIISCADEILALIDMAKLSAHLGIKHDPRPDASSIKRYALFSIRTEAVSLAEAEKAQGFHFCSFNFAVAKKI